MSGHPLARVSFLPPSKSMTERHARRICFVERQRAAMTEQAHDRTRHLLLARLAVACAAVVGTGLPAIFSAHICLTDMRAISKFVFAGLSANHHSNFTAPAALKPSARFSNQFWLMCISSHRPANVPAKTAGVSR